MPTKREIQKQETRKRILNTSYNLICKNGFAVTTNAIAKEAGISHGTVFSHFPTADDLIGTLLDSFGDELGMQLHDLIQVNSDPEQFLRKHLEILKKHEDFYHHFVTELYQLPEKARLAFISIQSIVSFHFSKMVPEQKQTQVPVHMWFNTWMGMLHYYLINKELFAPESSVLDAHSEELVQTFLNFIGE